MRPPVRSRARSEAMRENWENPEYREKQSAHLRTIWPKAHEKRRQGRIENGDLLLKKGTPEYREYIRIYKIARRILEKAARVKATSACTGAP